MLQPNTLRFLTDLKGNNNKPWFDEHRSRYETANADFLQFVTAALDGLEPLDPAIAASNLSAKSAVFRINRDVRFSNDKSPYKSSFTAWFNAGGKNSPSGGYYINVEPGDSFVAGGMYMPDPDTLGRIRQELDYNLSGFTDLLKAPAFTAYYKDIERENSLKRPPKGYDETNPAIAYLKLKSFTAVHRFTDAELVKPDLTAKVLGAFQGLQPIVHYLNQALN